MSTQENQWATLWTAQQQLHRSGLQTPRQLEHLPYILTAVFNGMTGNLLDQRCSQSPKMAVLNGIIGTVLDRRKFNAKTNYFSMFWPNLLGRYLQKGASLVRRTERGDVLEMQVEKGIKIKNRLVIDCLRQWSWIGRKRRWCHQLATPLALQSEDAALTTETTWKAIEVILENEVMTVKHQNQYVCSRQMPLRTISHLKRTHSLSLVRSGRYSTSDCHPTTSSTEQMCDLPTERQNSRFIWWKPDLMCHLMQRYWQHTVTTWLIWGKAACILQPYSSR